MKTVAKSVAAVSMALALGTSAGHANADASLPAMLMHVSPAILAAGLIGTGAILAADDVQACDKEPLRTVAWKNNPDGYTFTVAGCDYQAKKDRLVIVK